MLDISKTNFVIFHAINKPNHNVTILINKPFTRLNYVKYLGILIDSHLTFKDHINELNKKISRAIGILYRLRKYVTTKILCNVYNAIIYPFLLYGITVWGNASRSLLKPIHIMQKKIVRMVTFNDINATLPGPLPHTAPLFHQLKVYTYHKTFLSYR